MEDRSQGQVQEQARPEGAGGEAGLYVYCIGPALGGGCCGVTGIEGREVDAVVHRGLSALVHPCPVQPYQTANLEVTASWVQAHHRVVEAAWKQWGTVLPLSFNTIIRPEGGLSAADALRMWLEHEEGALQAKLDALRGKAEYSFQVFWDPVVIGRQVAEASPDVKRLEEEVQSKPRGLAYMYRQRLEKLLREGMEARAAQECRELYGRVARCAERVHVSRPKEGQEGQVMLLNLSCLVSTGMVAALEAEADGLSGREGFSVRFVGPFPPYSFC